MSRRGCQCEANDERALRSALGLGILHSDFALITSSLLSDLAAIVGARLRAHVRRRRAIAYGTDALKRGHPADAGRPAGWHRRGRRHRPVCAEHACRSSRAAPAPATPAAPSRSAAASCISLERMNRILEIDEENLLAVVEPNVVTGDLQDAVETVGLFYPPDPAMPAAVRHRRQRRRMRRRTARVQVRHHQALRARRSRRCCRPARSSRPAASRQERRRLRPDAAPGRLGGDARDHHASHPSAGAEAAGAGDAARDVPDVEAAVER